MSFLVNRKVFICLVIELNVTVITITTIVIIFTIIDIFIAIRPDSKTSSSDNMARKAKICRSVVFYYFFPMISDALQRDSPIGHGRFMQ